MLSPFVRRCAAQPLASAAHLIAFATLFLIGPGALAAAGLPDPTTGTRGHAPFVESNGYVVMEAESVDLVADWAVVDLAPPGDPTMAGALGAGYLEWQGNQFFGNTVSVAAAVGILDYEFHVSRAGVYLFRWRSKQYSDVGTFDAGNDSFVRFATGSPVAGHYDFGNFSKVWVQSRTNWSWQTTFEPIHGQHHVNTARRHFTPGLHKIQIAARSPGHAIDRIVLHHESNPFDQALFESLPESTTGATGEPIFDDGFESGDMLGWSLVMP